MRDLGTLGGRRSQPAAINERGPVVGDASTKSGAYHPFLWERAECETSARLVGTWSEAKAINERGQVVGTLAKPRTAGRTGSFGRTVSCVTWAPSEASICTIDQSPTRRSSVEIARRRRYGRSCHAHPPPECHRWGNVSRAHVTAHEARPGGGIARNDGDARTCPPSTARAAVACRQPATPAGTRRGVPHRLDGRRLQPHRKRLRR